MLYNSEIVSKLKTELRGFKVAWDAGLPFDQHEWLIGFPKLSIEKKIKAVASDDLKKWIRKWKSQRFEIEIQKTDILFSRAGIEQCFGTTLIATSRNFISRDHECPFRNIEKTLGRAWKKYGLESRKPLYNFIIISKSNVWK